MAKCYICNREHGDNVERVAGKNVCDTCHKYLGNGSWLTPEMEVQAFIRFDSKSLADPTRSSGGRFRRHKG